jgi:hypothetical protein
MDAVWINFLYNPLLPLGILLSFLAALAFLTFLRGFLSGVLYIFTLNGNDDFLKAARIRVFWGFLLAILFWIMWQVLLWVGAILTGDPAPSGLPLAFIFSLPYCCSVGSTLFKEKYSPTVTRNSLLYQHKLTVLPALKIFLILKINDHGARLNVALFEDLFDNLLLSERTMLAQNVADNVAHHS